MSGSTIDYSALFTSSADSSGSSLLNILYGATGSGSSSFGALQALTSAERNQTKEIAITAKQPQVKRDVDAFRAAVSSAKDAATLLKNPTALKVLLTANGLGDQTDYAALASKALLSDPADSKSLVNRLSDTRWKTVAQTYNFATKGLATLRDPKVQSTLADAYAEVSWRQSLDQSTPGLSNALSFRAQAAKITSVDQILGDATLRKVVTTALGVPQEIAFQSLQAQELAISNRLDITKFKDPHYVESFTQRYLLAAQTNATSTGGSLYSLAAQSRSLVV